MRLLASRLVAHTLLRPQRLTTSSRLTLMATSSSGLTFESLNFDNLALRSLPIDPVAENYVREVRGACFSKVSGERCW